MSHPSLQGRVVACDPPAYHGGRRPRSHISAIVLHATADAASAHATIKWMNTQRESKISYHYVIDRDGAIYRMCVPELVAYHAGDSALPADPAKAPHQGASVNGHTVGISFANDNVREPITTAQRDSALWLCAVFCQPNGIPVSRVVSHAEVSPQRKTDPITLDLPAFRQQLADYLAAA